MEENIKRTFDTIEEFRMAFEYMDVQIHVNSVEEWDACIDALVDLGYTYHWDRDYWRDRKCFYIVSHGRLDRESIGLNDTYRGMWGGIIEYDDFLAVGKCCEEIPMTAADSADILSLLGM